MFLLNSILIGTYLEEDNGVLKITDFAPENLEHTFYYFRLGANASLNGKPMVLSNKIGHKFLTLEPNDFALITTLESFTLSAKILGILGQCSEITNQGLLLIHSPFIDPRYSNTLGFGIKNVSNETTTLEYGVDKIGKVSFFDISDTYPIKIDPYSSFAKRFLANK
jgi:deoxycytidine triphosphate deaminase